MSDEDIGVSVSEEEIGVVDPALDKKGQEEIGAFVTAVDTHFPLVDKYGQSYISTTSTMLLGLGATTLSRTKGIKLTPGQTFRYDGGKKPKEGGIVNKLPQKKHSLYLYEAGINPRHVDTLQHEIYIYVKGCKDEDDPIVVGILSKEYPTVSLELTLSEKFQLSHSSNRKEVFFNGFRFTLWKSPKIVDKNKILPDRVVWSRPRPVILEAKKVWVAEVHPSEELWVPVNEGKEYYLLKIYSKENTEESITEESIKLHAHCNGKMKFMGELVNGCSPIRFNTLFDDDFVLSHTSSTTTVVFFGYTVPFQFKLKELNEYQQPSKGSLKASKISLDPEYQSYCEILAKEPIPSMVKHTMTSAPSMMKHSTSSRQPLIAPFIVGCRLDRKSLRTPLGRKKKVSAKDKCKKRKRRHDSPAAEDTPELG